MTSGTAPEASDGFLEVGVEIPTAHVDAVSNFIIEQLANGIVLDEEEDSNSTGLTFYVPWGKVATYRDAFEQYLTDVLGYLPPIRTRRVDDVAWIEAYKASIQPIVIQPDIVIRPPWAMAPVPTSYDILIEPKMAFGTGTHETTRGCLISIRELFQPGWQMLDIGTGSGILAILAAKMGATAVKAIDYDQIAVANCRENFEINEVSCLFEILHGSIETVEPTEQYELVCANIIRSAILPMLPELLRATKPGGWLLLSGLLKADEAIITAAIHEQQQHSFSIHAEGEWLTYRIHIQ